VGEDGHLHRRFLADFYAGDFPGSFGRGARFQPEPNGEARTSGTAASLAGLEAALEARDAREADLAIRRILLLHALAFAHGGLPLVYMGDELGLCNDHAYEADPVRRDDNRWMHRPAMDWEAAERRHDPATVEGRLWAGLRALVDARWSTQALHAHGRSEPVWTGNERVFGLVREHAGDRLLVLANLSEEGQWVDAGVLHRHAIPTQGDGLELAPYAWVWLTG
jgi:amylosucrase